jgi:hypothetical protein
MASRKARRVPLEMGPSVLITCLVQTLNGSDKTFQKRFLKRLEQAYVALENDPSGSTVRKNLNQARVATLGDPCSILNSNPMRLGRRRSTGNGNYVRNCTKIVPKVWNRLAQLAF